MHNFVNILQGLASASGAYELSQPQICIWDLQTLTCKKMLTHHNYDIVSLAYSRDDRYLISVGMSMIYKFHYHKKLNYVI